MTQLDRLRDARARIRREAVARWLRRAAPRADNRAAVAAHGPGAADSAQRNSRFERRNATMDRMSDARLRGELPLGLERRMGPTLDYVAGAPNEAAQSAGRPVARVVEMDAQGRPPVGIATGFLVGAGLFLTNHHVFPARADAHGLFANFLYERDEAGVNDGVFFEFDPRTFYVSDARLDFALVALQPVARDGTSLHSLGVLALVEAVPKILVGLPVNIIQHPEGGVKQYATTQNRLLDVLDEGFLHYETDTLEGSSGSPAFSAAWELVALHHASIPAVSGRQILSVDGTPWTPEQSEDRVQWVANEGTRISAIVHALSAMRLSSPTEQRALAELLEMTADPVDEFERAVEQGTPRAGNAISAPNPASTNVGGMAMQDSQLHFSGPVTINLQAQRPAQPAEAPKLDPVPRQAGALEKVIRFDPDVSFKNRKGYDPGFLGSAKGLHVPLPGVVKAREGELLAGSNGKPRVLKYHHFSLVMHAGRRLQMWSASNVDYDSTKKSQRSRDEFGRDRWALDPRIPAAAQLQDKEFYAPAKNIDRGHIVRREDNAWGDNETAIEYANSDTFHWTNCTPQHEAFNQASPGASDPVYKGMSGLWGAFENHIQRSRKGNDTRACVLAGPVLDKDDPRHDFGSGTVQYPLRFWKVVCIADGEAEDAPTALQAFGFVLSQEDVVAEFGIEAFDPGRFKKYMRPLKDITKLTGVTFAASLEAADMKDKS